MSIAINVNGQVARPAAPRPRRERATQERRVVRPTRSREEQLRFETGLIRHLMLGSAALVAGGYGAVMAVTAL